MEKTRNILITGGSGFIGSYLIDLFVKKYPHYFIINLDKLTYAGSTKNNSLVENDPNYLFVQGDICDHELVNHLFELYKIDGVINLAAESHVDRSIENPMEFIQTNIIGTATILNVAEKHWKELSNPNYRFHHVSTDEVYGQLGETGAFTEETPYNPRSPYSASKASSDHLVSAYFSTYKLPTIISNCSNNFGPRQYAEKLIPVVVQSIINNKEIPVYGSGTNVRDWLYVQDHVEAIDVIFHDGILGEKYNIGGGTEMSNLEIVYQICDCADEILHRNIPSKSLIKFVTDRKGHDFRYAIDSTKMETMLNWKAKSDFKSNLINTIQYYANI